jgi:hypothetical protein
MRFSNSQLGVFGSGRQVLAGVCNVGAPSFRWCACRPAGAGRPVGSVGTRFERALMKQKQQQAACLSLQAVGSI